MTTGHGGGGRRKLRGVVVLVGLTFTGTALLLFIAISVGVSTKLAAPLAVSIAALFAGSFYFLSTQVSPTEIELRQLRSAANVAVGEITGPDDILGLIRANSKLMESYEVLARSQARSAHIATLIAGACGLAAVGAGIAVAVTAEATAAKYAAAIVAAVGTATGGYIAATFIRVQEAAMIQMRYYFQRPLVQSYLFQAERLSKKLTEDADQTTQLKAVIAATLTQTTQITSAKETLRQPITPLLPPAPAAPDK